MVHNGIEYGDMQLIAEVYDVLKNIGGLSNDELFQVRTAGESEAMREQGEGDAKSHITAHH